MFDAKTTELLSSAPPVPGLDPADIPALLTRHYARLVSVRLRGADVSAAREEDWPLERIADTYELISALSADPSLRRSSAFVAATAQQIIARRAAATLDDTEAKLPNITRDRIDPAICATLLFLAAEQYADAHEAAGAVNISKDFQSYEASILSENIVALARGQLNEILERSMRWRSARRGQDLEERAQSALLEALISGVEGLAARFLNIPIPEVSAGRFESPGHAFSRVLELSARVDEGHTREFRGDAVFASPGPHHLAALLLNVEGGISNAALTAVPPPNGADLAFWDDWLRFRAENFPYVWPNHREAIGKNFYQTGTSSVVVLPTGAGKTTISSLKIAGVLARGKKVIFLAPTHALVEQLTEDLQNMFPEDLLGSSVSSDFDLLFRDGGYLKEIEVMTPERCLAMLSFAQESFEDVGLLVFDECHLLSPQSGKIRRAIDSMLCVLGFNHIAPEADTLFLSAMVDNGSDFAKWIEDITGRPCISIDLKWKPSRQARGVVIYNEDDYNKAINSAKMAQNRGDVEEGRRAKGLRVSAKSRLALRPWAVWGLQHNWADASRSMIRTRLLDNKVPLSGELKGRVIRVKPNANKVAASLAVAGAESGLKSIVFVNTKRDAITTARGISKELGIEISATEAEEDRWSALEAELGSLEHSYLSKSAAAVPHNSLMLRLERDLAERMFKRADGAQVIVATPTLAQGLNLPAHLAILAGDKRASANRQGREALEAHEILNAAARAGRAGHLANGVVLMVPEPNITFRKGASASIKLKEKLKTLLPEDDHCVALSDPLEVVLDRIMEGETADRDVRYVVNRMAAFNKKGDGDTAQLFDLRRSYGAFYAKSRKEESVFNQKIDALVSEISNAGGQGIDMESALLASQSGLSTEVLLSLKTRIQSQIGNLPTTVKGWLLWAIDWLSEDDEARELLLSDVADAIKSACGAKRGSAVTPADLALIAPGLVGWIKGLPIVDIELLLKGDPDDERSENNRTCPRARELVANVVPRGFSFVIGLIAHVTQEIDPFEAQGNLKRSLVEVLSVAVRKGFDSFDLVAFSSERRGVVSRVQTHLAWMERVKG